MLVEELIRRVPRRLEGRERRVTGLVVDRLPSDLQIPVSDPFERVDMRRKKGV